MLKFLLIIIVIIFCTLLGYLISSKYSNKKDYYNDFYNFILELIQNVSFNQKTILEILKDKGNNCFYNLSISVFNKKKYNKPNFLIDNDVKLLEKFINSIGKNNPQNEIKLLESYKKIIEDELNKAKYEYEKNKNIYIKLGFLIGIMISIIIL